MPLDFETKEYWHDRFAKETRFDWLISSEAFMSVLESYLHHASNLRIPIPEVRILHLGFGTSDLHTRLRAHGFRKITNVDFEPLAVQRGEAIERDAFGNVAMEYVVADVTEMRLRDEYDLIVDKSAVDSVACGGEHELRKMAGSVDRCLVEGGCWISLSFSSSRFDVPEFPFVYEVIGKFAAPKMKPMEPDIYYYCYLLRRKSSNC